MSKGLANGELKAVAAESVFDSFGRVNLKRACTRAAKSLHGTHFAVGIYMERSVGQVVATYGVVLSGKAFLTRWLPQQARRFFFECLRNC